MRFVDFLLFFEVSRSNHHQTSSEVDEVLKVTYESHVANRVLRPRIPSLYLSSCSLPPRVFARAILVNAPCLLLAADRPAQRAFDL